MRTSDLVGFNNGSFEDVLYSQNSKFNAAGDLDGNGEVDTLDLFALATHFEANPISPSVLAGFNGVVERRGDMDVIGDISISSFKTHERRSNPVPRCRGE